MLKVAENIWMRHYPLPLLGADIGRTVTVIRLVDDSVVVHSTAPFSAEDVREVKELGRVRWVLDAMLDHDTFAEAGREAFPGAAYLGPAGFSERVGFPCKPLLPTPGGWCDELQVLAINGAPKIGEHVFFHAPSRTLIVADLIVNFGQERSWWTRLLVRMGVGANAAPGISRRFKAAISDRRAFSSSLEKMLAWDFDRVIVGHGKLLEKNPRERIIRLFEREGLLA